MTIQWGPCSRPPKCVNGFVTMLYIRAWICQSLNIKSTLLQALENVSVRELSEKLRDWVEL